MSETILYANVASELLELYKYFDDILKEKIPNEIINNLEKCKNKENNFTIDTSKNLNDQNILPQTKQALSVLYLKYCCTEQEKNRLLLENKRYNEQKEREKKEKYSIDNIFNKDNTNSNIKISNTQMIKENDIFPWYKKIWNNITKWFKSIIGG